MYNFDFELKGQYLYDEYFEKDRQSKMAIRDRGSEFLYARRLQEESRVRKFTEREFLTRDWRKSFYENLTMRVDGLFASCCSKRFTTVIRIDHTNILIYLYSLTLFLEIFLKFTEEFCIRIFKIDSKNS